MFSDGNALELNNNENTGTHNCNVYGKLKMSQTFCFTFMTLLKPHTKSMK